MERKNYISDLKNTFQSYVDPVKAERMRAYMKNKFDFLGIRSPLRKSISNLYMKKDIRPSADELWPVIHQLWELPEREYQYFAMELMAKYKREITVEWIYHLGLCITRKSWWDTVDFIASNLVGSFFSLYPDNISPVTESWMRTENIWLQRSCLLYQLKYREKTDTQRLSGFILSLNTSREFFITKAIGWSLREYSKYNASWVIDFVHKHELQPLSRKEALRRIN